MPETATSRPGKAEIAGATTIVRPIEVSRERVGEHSWRVTLSDGTTQEEISWAECYRPAPMAERGPQPKKRGKQ